VIIMPEDEWNDSDIRKLTAQLFGDAKTQERDCAQKEADRLTREQEQKEQKTRNEAIQRLRSSLEESA